MRNMTTEVNGLSHRYNNGKIKLSNVPPKLLQVSHTVMSNNHGNFPIVALAKLAEHYTLAELKYPNAESEQGHSFPNWAKGQLWESFLIDSALRHLYAKVSGELIDDDFGSEHLVAVAWCFAALFHYVDNYELYKEFDDRKFVGFNIVSSPTSIEYMSNHLNLFYLIHHIQVESDLDLLRQACLFGFLNTLIAIEFEDETIYPNFKLTPERVEKVKNTNYGESNVSKKN